MTDSNLAHMVFFTLKDGSAENIAAFEESVHKYLNNHDGIVYFSAGTMVPDLERPVNDRDFHVALHVVFDSRASHDAYQTAERHLQFVEECKDKWETVRIFDSYVR